MLEEDAITKLYALNRIRLIEIFDMTDTLKGYEERFNPELAKTLNRIKCSMRKSDRILPNHSHSRPLKRPLHSKAHKLYVTSAARVVILSESIKKEEHSYTRLIQKYCKERKNGYVIHLIRKTIFLIVVNHPKKK